MTDVNKADAGIGKPENSCFSRYIRFIINPNACATLSLIIIVIMFFFQILKTSMTYLMSDKWQLSGYYLSAMENGLILFVAVTWLASVVILFLKREYGHGLIRILATLPLFFVFAIAAAIMHLMLPSRICGWPSDTIYLKDDAKYFLISRGPLPIDVYYHVYSTTGTLFNPVWTFEFSTGCLDYSQSRTEKPHLILSEDGQLLVMCRGNHLADAYLLGSKVSLVHGIRDPHVRNSKIESLLQTHSSKTKSGNIQNPLTYLHIRTILKEYYQKLGKQLTEHFKNDEWIVSCELSEVDWDKIRIHARYSVECSRRGKTRYFSRDMTLVEDHDRLIITEQDTGLSWSDDEEKMLCERVRDAITHFAGAGTYVN